MRYAYAGDNNMQIQTVGVEILKTIICQGWDCANIYDELHMYGRETWKETLTIAESIQVFQRVTVKVTTGTQRSLK